MNFADLARKEVMKQPVYEPGKPIEDVARELGLDAAEIIKLASNENPHGASPKAIAAAREALSHAQLYPDGGCFELRRKLAAHWALKPEQFVMGNGSNEVIELLGHVFLEPGDEVIMGAPAFIVYKLVALMFGARPVEVPLAGHAHDLAAMRRAVTARTKMVFVATPNNPTGGVNGEAELQALVRGLPRHVICVVDEAYAEFQTSAPDLRPLIAEGRPVVGLRTFSKIHGLAALRVGYGYGDAGLIGLLERMRQPFNVNAIGQRAAVAALEDQDFAAHCRQANAAGLKQLYAGLTRLGTAYVPSAANFLLVEVGDGATVFAELQTRGVIVRPMRGYGLPAWIRVTVGTEAQNERFLKELEAVLARCRRPGGSGGKQEV